MVLRRDTFSVRLSDVADVEIKRTIPNRVFLVEGVAAIQVSITPLDGGDLTSLTDDSTKILSESVSKGTLPADTQFLFYLDPAKYIRRSISSVVQSALVGGILAILIVFLFLGEVRNTIIVAVSIPISVIYSIFLMWAIGMSFNLISLGGLALSVGMIVDATTGPL